MMHDRESYAWTTEHMSGSCMHVLCRLLYFVVSSCTAVRTYVDIYTYWLAHPVHTHALVLRLNSVDRSTITSNSACDLFWPVTRQADNPITHHACMILKL